MTSEIDRLRAEAEILDRERDDLLSRLEEIDAEKEEIGELIMAIRHNDEFTQYTLRGIG